MLMPIYILMTYLSKNPRMNNPRPIVWYFLKHHDISKIDTFPIQVGEYMQVQLASILGYKGLDLLLLTSDYALRSGPEHGISGTFFLLLSSLHGKVQQATFPSHIYTMRDCFDCPYNITYITQHLFIKCISYK